jgi:hypothetical protein
MKSLKIKEKLKEKGKSTLSVFDQIASFMKCMTELKQLTAHR